ncbi:MAG: hypothetical protein GXO50_06155 [Chlorobi bacterium]|nr:hypothetical protein [Chlorobiota bacterium]
MKYLVFTFVLAVFSSAAFSQSGLSAELLTVSTHPFAGQNLSLHMHKIDKNGYITFEPGIIISYNRHIKKRISIKISTAALKDRFDTFAGYGTAMLKYKILKYYKHSVYAGAGLSVFYETDKSYIEDWINEDNYKLSGNTLYKISISGFLEYNYRINKKTDLVLSINHTHLKSFALGTGIRIKLPNPGGKGCDCPSFK